MKKSVVFILGVVVGIIITFLLLLIIGKATNKADSEPSGLTMFETRGELIEQQSFKVFQTIDNAYALARAQSEHSDYYLGMVVMLVGDENSHFYDELIVKANKYQSFYQVGTYEYQTQTGRKVVPVIMLLDDKK